MTESKASTIAADAVHAKGLDAFIGKSLDALPTPCLLIDRPRFFAALKAMQSHAAKHGKQIRAHSKSHKCPQMGKHQIEAGAVGICCAKLSEALAMAQNGVTGTLVTSPLATAYSLSLLPKVLQLDKDLIL
jgi:D-serine deaminase-like pyridoxal phosphate-dependent protein